MVYTKFMNSSPEEPSVEQPSLDNPKKVSRRGFLRLAGGTLAGVFLGSFLRQPTTSQAAVLPDIKPQSTEKIEISEDAVKGLSEALARGWIVYQEGSQGDSSDKVAEVWEKSARNGLELCSFLFQNRENVAQMAEETFPEVTLDPNSELYYDCLAVRRTRLNSIDLSLYLAILATENADMMKIVNCYEGGDVRHVFDPDSYPQDYFSPEGDIWRAQNLLLGLRADYGLYLAPGGDGPFTFDITEGGLNEELMGKYNSANPWWVKRVTSLYKEIHDFAQETPGMEFLTDNICQTE